MSATIFSADPIRPVVVAHRGSGPGLSLLGHRENTVGGLQWAAACGADWIECDVQLSADGDLVLQHNVLLDGRTLRGSSTRELRRRGVQTVAEAHEALPAGVGIDLDLKISLADVSAQDQVLFQAAIDWADQARTERPLLLSSFCPSLLQHRTSVPLCWRANRSAWYYESVVSAVRLGAPVAGLHADDVLDEPADCPTGAEVGAFAREHDVAVLAWGVRPADVPALVGRGVTGLCGDDVPGLVRAVRELERPVETLPVH